MKKPRAKAAPATTRAIDPLSVYIDPKDAELFEKWKASRTGRRYGTTRFRERIRCSLYLRREFVEKLDGIAYALGDVPNARSNIIEYLIRVSPSKISTKDYLEKMKFAVQGQRMRMGRPIEKDYSEFERKLNKIADQMGLEHV